MGELQVEYVSADTLLLAPYNPRRISDDALARLAKLLDLHGFVDPIIARREDSLVIGGHQRLKANALRPKPDERVPVIFLDGISDPVAKALNIALNNPHAQGEWDFPKLVDVLNEIDTGEIDVPNLTAFSEADIAGLMHGADEFQRADEPSDSPEASQFRCPKCGYQWAARTED